MGKENSDDRFKTLKEELIRLVELNSKEKKLGREVRKLKEELDKMAETQALEVLKVLAETVSDEEMPDIQMWFCFRNGYVMLEIIFRFSQGKQPGQLLLIERSGRNYDKVIELAGLWTPQNPKKITAPSDHRISQNEWERAVRQVAWLDPKGKGSVVGKLRQLCDNSEGALSRLNKTKQELLAHKQQLETV